MNGMHHRAGGVNYRVTMPPGCPHQTFTGAMRTNEQYFSAAVSKAPYFFYAGLFKLPDDLLVMHQVAKHVDGFSAAGKIMGDADGPFNTETESGRFGKVNNNMFLHVI
jgi:hypothetical protein